MDVQSLPELLQTPFQHAWSDFEQQAQPELQQALQQNKQIFDSVLKIWSCSPFVAKGCILSVGLLDTLLKDDYLLQPYEKYELNFDVETDENQVMQQLRAYRRREMAKIAWRDMAGWASLDESLRALSDLADTLIDAALNYQYAKWEKQWGTPLGRETGEVQKLIVLGMGKLGGRELNFSSDIDLIFAYPESGETNHPRRPRTNQEFFLRVGQQVIHLLNTVTGDGFVFRVDMRLRPFGDSGPLVMHFAAMEDYYQSHARDWERYAFIKARAVAGDIEQGESLLDMLKPFVYRRYLDYNSITEFRHMKEMIDQEAHRKGLENNIKLGRGGIREVEFTCQLFQLMRGGRQPGLQERNLLKTLAALREFDLLSEQDADGLEQAYRFLRTAENRLQAIDDQQTQTLPSDELNQQRLAYIMGFEQWDEFMAALDKHLDVVNEQFEQVFAPEIEDTPVQHNHENIWESVWENQLDNDDVVQYFETAEYEQPEQIVKKLREFASSYTLQKLSSRARQRLDMVMPLLLEATSQDESKDLALLRTLEFISAIAQRSVYLALLVERPQVLRQLIKLCSASQWVATQLTRYPLLLDELLDPRRLYDPLKPNELDSALQAQIAHLPLDDLEMQMDSLRQFKRAHVLHVAAAELSGNLSVELASDYLGAIADTIVKKALSIAWNFITHKHGKPQFKFDDEIEDAGFCVIGYGKSGGIELSYSSDLDIVFVHNSHGSSQMTDGAKCVDNNVFFMRLAQRIIHIITTNTAAGSLYEVDSRLRPGGNAGMMVASFDSFEKYQFEDAWTWEHQALVRARAIAGDKSCMDQFETIRRKVLAQKRDPEKLKQDVCEMREKMRSNLDKSNKEVFDIKQGAGGVVDIEFLIQYGVLRWAIDFPDLLDTTGMLPMLRKFVTHDLLTESACERLSNAYRAYRAETHRLALQDKPVQVKRSKFAEHQSNVQHLWKRVMG
ncbi:bifunctional [glutamate--ammonia ligase]-adenylyl-L-tyrosine phosphorylase/[glutamate--ammonia-ligase] adenylyltransferase [Candidatus Albibeggiatoa sp. nov. NOAA]|uniref:bifunctional [glutamate--ammonia ligase]-adenylyl-L-tyrosine phosphorylase/[glutamate--ammonia-ligase] adenylyltransferase n=1 Tax=Candidatus Albibeggiatoa sp. nov. NOAA TaxID=3162724 RepID=UPI0033040C2A|nr:bifunctional [glutamate--ammonia ligase]-adenylyl-L-tyrosine phosphorylase/[glutamate--ammonia-ligase] adenylyltransferase [Thiotrichaceae bacterium]